MEAIGCLVPELQSEMCSGCRVQLFVLCKVTRDFMKKQLRSQQRQLGKTASGYKSGGFIVSMDRNTTIRTGSW